MLALKQHEILRHAQSLPGELAEWVQRTSTLGSGGGAAAQERYASAHFSQIQAVKAVIEELLKPQAAQVAALNAGGNAQVFMQQALDITTGVIAAQTFWDFYRDMFEQRFSPRMADGLWVADTVAWDCYHSVIAEAQMRGIVGAGALREPPLTYLAPGFAPLTWVRTSLPQKDGSALMGTWARRLPFALIEIPWEHMENPWEFMALHHEVGHDLEKDLGIFLEVQAALDTVLTAGGVPVERRAVWSAWQKEILADLVGLQLGGGAFAIALASLLLLPPQAVMTYDSGDPHPTHYVRIRLCARYLKTLLPKDTPEAQRMAALSDALEADWIALYGDGAGTPFEPLLADFELVATAVMDTALPALKNSTLRSLMPYDVQDDNAAHQLADFWKGVPGVLPPAIIKPRHIITAARLAVHGAGVDTALLDKVKAAVVVQTQKHAAPGLRAGGSLAVRQQRVAALAKDIFSEQQVTLQNRKL